MYTEHENVSLSGAYAISQSQAVPIDIYSIHTVLMLLSWQDFAIPYRTVNCKLSLIYFDSVYSFFCKRSVILILCDFHRQLSNTRKPYRSVANIVVLNAVCVIVNMCVCVCVCGVCRYFCRP